MKREFYLTLAFTFALFVTSYAANGVDQALKTELLQPAAEIFSEEMPQMAQKTGFQKPGKNSDSALLEVKSSNNGNKNQAPAAKKPAAKKPVSKKPVKPVKEETKFQKNFAWGFMGGATFTWLSEGTKSRESFAGGLFAEYMFTKKLGVVIEAQYSDQGAQVYILKEDMTVKQRDFTGLKYLNIPVMLQYKLTDHINFKVGAQYGYMMSGIYKLRKQTRLDTYPITQGYNNYDIAIPVAVSYNFDSGIFFEARYAYGLTVITRYEETLVKQLPEYKNRVATLSIGYKF